MKLLTKEEQQEVTGGAISGWTIAGIAAGIVFILGCFSGYTNPEKCN